MLRRLQIENFALITRADLAFADGSTIITGETGSGKSMLIGALLFALGERASADLVGRDGDRARVIFTFDSDETQRAMLVEHGFELDPGEAVEIVRELHSSGKSSLRINGRASTAAFVRDFAPYLLDVVGQHEAQRLLAPRYHLALLDRFGGDELIDAREHCGNVYLEFVASSRALAELEATGAAARRQYDEAKEIVASIETLAPHIGESSALRERAKILASAQKITVALTIAHDGLASDETGAMTAVGVVRSAMDGIRELSGQFADLAVRIESVQNEIGEIAADIAKLADEVEYDAMEVERINERIDALDRLERRFGGSLDAVFEAQERAQSIIEAAELSSDHIVAATLQHEDNVRALRLAADRLRTLRTSAALALETAVQSEFSDLALGAAQLHVVFEDLDEITAIGDQRVAFHFRANAGEGLRPLAQVASGGELSRVLLGLIVSLAGSRESTALVFDEIDAGIGGATASAVGTRIARLSQDSQIVCVTHLAQIAVHAEVHAVLEKHEDESGTTIALRTLHETNEKIDEIARMLSGESHSAARNHARELLAAAQ